MNIFVLIAALLISLVSGLAGTLLASLWAIAAPVLTILAIGASAHLGTKLVRRIYKSNAERIYSMPASVAISNHAD